MVSGPPLSLEIDTFAPPHTHGDIFAEVASELGKIVIEAALCSECYVSSFYHEVRSGHESRQYQATIANWQILLRRIQAGDLRFLSLSIGTPASDESPFLDYVIEVRIDFCSLEWPDIANRLSVYVSQDVLPPGAGENALVPWFTGSAARLGAATGYIATGYVGSQTPYEKEIGRNWSKGLANAAAELRGVFWGNLLSPTHIERLGGLERVLRDAPGIATAIQNDPALVYCQLTEDLAAQSDEHARAFHDFVKPILPGPE
jgi:hypothetical protein